MLFPDPDGPTIAVEDPTFILKVEFYRTFLICSKAVGYFKVTFSNLIAEFMVNCSKAFSISFIFGILSLFFFFLCCTIVLFPDPDGPTIAVEDPTFILKVEFYRTFLICSKAVGYLKVTFSNLIAEFKVNCSKAFSLSFILGILSMTSNTFLPTTCALAIAYKLGLRDIRIIIAMSKEN